MRRCFAQTTTGTALAALLGVPFIPMDTLLFDPGWVQTSGDEFRAKLRAALDADARGWVADGNYTKTGGGMAFDEATDIICQSVIGVRCQTLTHLVGLSLGLDPPLYVYFPRLLLRTFLRLFRLVPPCSPGCFESPTEVFFSHKSIIWWCLSNHWNTRRRNAERMELIGIEAGSDVAGRKMRRFGGWGTDVKEWLRDVAAMLRSKRD